MSPSYQPPQRSRHTHRQQPHLPKELQKLIASIALEDDAQLEEINGEIDGKK